MVLLTDDHEAPMDELETARRHRHAEVHGLHRRDGLLARSRYTYRRPVRYHPPQRCRPEARAADPTAAQGDCSMTGQTLPDDPNY